MNIEIFYGNRQRFRYRHGDINILGSVPRGEVPQVAEYRLNGSDAVPFYIEPAVRPGKGSYAWGTRTPSVFRLQDRPGWFNIEIPIDAPNLVEGRNEVEIRIRTQSGLSGMQKVEFAWDARPVPLPLLLRDLKEVDSIQDIGQAVNGRFELDRDSNGIRSASPVGADVLFLLGSPHGSQEATYEVRFNTDGRTGVYIGLSDFFVGHSEQTPGLGIKPGYSTAGLASLKPRGWAQLWIADGDCLSDKAWSWVARSPYPSRFVVDSHRSYRVRHQVLITPAANVARFRIWPAEQAEPASWLCTLDTRRVDSRRPRLPTGSFGLFQFGGGATTWSDIAVKSLDVDNEHVVDILRSQPRHVIGLVRKVQKAVLDRWPALPQCRLLWHQRCQILRGPRASRPLVFRNPSRAGRPRTDLGTQSRWHWALPTRAPTRTNSRRASSSLSASRCTLREREGSRRNRFRAATESGIVHAPKNWFDSLHSKPMCFLGSIEERNMKCYLFFAFIVAAAATVWRATPLAAAEDLGQHGFADSDGVKIHFVTNGNGPLLVMLHGFPDYWYTWRKQMPVLAGKFQVVAIDQRGYNKSDQPEGVENYAMPKLVGDVKAVVEHFGQKRAVIVGHDWGGAVAWSFAMAHPEMTERLVILNLPHPNGLRRELANNPEQRKASEYARRFQQADAASQLTAEGLTFWIKDADAREKYVAAFKRSSFEAMLNYYKANYPREPYEQPTAEVPKVKCPVLMIHGLRDTALLPGALNDTWQWLDSDLTLVTIPDAGHFVQQDAAEFVTKQMENWLTR